MTIDMPSFTPNNTCVHQHHSAIEQQDSEAIREAAFTGNECTEGRIRAAYHTEATFIPLSPALRAWYAGVCADAKLHGVETRHC